MNTLASNSSKTVVVGMSGGVDSSVCAAVLKEQGFNVIGLFMKNWEEEDDNGVCQASKEYADVERVCDKLGIPCYSVEFVREYRDGVFSHFLKEYEAGHTPNPDILCNREIKFKVFFQEAMRLGADFLATGHYCQNKLIAGEHRLVKGEDPGKDQTYFLYAINGEVLPKVLFPIGHLQKSEVREIAHKYDLATKDKKDSTGICFIGERNFKNFLSNYLAIRPGPFETLDGSVVGEHSGVAYYTLGQRKGLGLGGQGEPWFVVGKDIERNVVIVERGEFHPALYTDGLTATQVSWIGGEEFARQLKERLPLKLHAKVRYRQKDQAATITAYEGDRLTVEFDHPQRAVTTRQSIVFYEEIDGESVCLGGAMIEAPFKNYFELQRELPKTLGQ